MASSITTSVTVFFIVVGVWAANLVCYHPATAASTQRSNNATAAR